MEKTVGRDGETRTAVYLEERGFEICCRNYRCRFGEIDIIAREPITGILCFVEVKTRSDLRKGRPCEAVTPSKLRCLRRTAAHYPGAISTGMRRNSHLCLGSSVPERADFISAIRKI